MRLLAAALVAAVPSFALGDCAGAYDHGGVPAMAQCLELAYSSTDARLNEIWPQVMSDFPSGGGRKAHKAEIRAAQRAWIAFRDAECAARAKVGIPKYWRTNELSCLVELTGKRIETLTESYLN